jgi:hypothetical protein
MCLALHENVLHRIVLNILSWFALALMVAGCNLSRERIVFPELEKSSDQINDSSFLVSVNAIVANNDGYYVLDEKLGYLVFFDRNLKAKFFYGTPGEGPGELISPSQFYLHKDGICVLNTGKQTFEWFNYNNARPVRTVTLPSTIVGLLLDTRFFCNNNIYYVSAPESGMPITIINEASPNVEGFGTISDYYQLQNPAAANARFLFKTSQGNILALSGSSPKLEIYDVSGNLLLQENLDNAHIKERRHFIESNILRDDGDSFYWYFRDCYHVGNRLYILTISGKDKPVCNVVYEYKVTEENIILIKSYKLRGEWYSSLAVHNNFLLAFETSYDKLELYELQ